MACVVALAGAGWLGLPLNLFSTVALWLVVGMGVDYSIFFREAGDDARTTTIGVLVDSITTLLSFGLLALSATPALRSFGTVLSIGLASAFVFAPLARSSAQRPYVPNPQ
jgi:predicted exporter